MGRTPRRSSYFTEFAQSEEITDYGNGVTAIRYFRDDTDELIGAAVFKDGWSQTGNLYDEDEITWWIEELGGTA